MATQFNENKMANLDLEIEYQFACHYMAFIEKLLSKTENPFQKYDEKAFWQLLSHNISSVYMSRHPENPWVKTPANTHQQFDCVLSVYCNQLTADNEITLDEMETEINRIYEYNHTPIDDCETCEANRPPYEYQHLVWFKKMSCSKNLSLSFLNYYVDEPWDLYCLAANPMEASKAQFKKEYLATLKIQKAFLQARYNPTYAYCRRLHSEFYQSLLSL